MNKVALVIGAGDATGGAIARRFAREQLDWPRIITAAATDLGRHVKLAPPLQLS